MKPDDTTKRIEPAQDRDENIPVEREVETEATEVHEPQPTGWAAQLRQIMQRSTQGEAKTNVKRQQLKEDQTKSFLLLAGLTVALSLAFLAMQVCQSTGVLSGRSEARKPVIVLPWSRRPVSRVTGRTMTLRLICPSELITSTRLL